MTWLLDFVKSEKKKKKKKQEEEHQVQACKAAYRNKRCNERKKEKRSKHYHHRESCPLMSLDDPNDSPLTSEEEYETKEEHIF